MLARVDEVTKSKSGKALRVRLGGKVYNAFLNSGLDAVVGKMIDATITPDTGYGEGIGQWGMVADAQPAPPVASAPAQATTGGSRLAEPELRFVSNLVASAITAGKITDPSEISVWAKAASATVREL